MMFQRKRGRRREAFTLIEVMVSLGVMTVGAMAILTLQQHSIRSNVHARKLSIAMEIAERWIERFKQDAATWNQVGVLAGVPDAAAVLAGTTWLKDVGNHVGEFRTIAVTPGTSVSNAFDYQGLDMPNTGSSFTYCASYRPSWVQYGRAMRVDVRVWWRREDVQRTTDVVAISTAFSGCADTPTASVLNPGEAEYANYHVVYLSTVIRMVEAL